MVRGIDQPSVGQANQGKNAMPKTKITWLARLIGNRTTTGERYGPDITQLKTRDIVTPWAIDDRPGPRSSTGSRAAGRFSNSIETGEL
jgi:hypothetical protein